MRFERVAHPAARVAVGHAVAAEQLLLALERQPGDRPAHSGALEQQLAAPLPFVLLRRTGRGREPLELAQRSGRQGVAHRQDVALGVGVVGGCDRLLARVRLATPGAPAHQAAFELRLAQSIWNQTAWRARSTPHSSASCSTRNRPQPSSASSGGAVGGGSKPGPESRTSTRTIASAIFTASMIESSSPTCACFTLFVTSSDTSSRTSNAMLASRWLSRSESARRAAVTAYGPPASSKLMSDRIVALSPPPAVDFKAPRIMPTRALRR